MSTATPVAPRTGASPRTLARVAGAFYLLNIVAGSMALVLGGGGATTGRAINLIATACYVVVTLLFYALFRPVDRRLSLLAALFSLAGCACGALVSLGLAHVPISPLVFFGVYCLLIALLALRSTFLPRFLGVLLAIGGLGWLSFAVPSLAHRLSPYNLAPGIVGETALTIWLLAVGLDEDRWKRMRDAHAVARDGRIRREPLQPEILRDKIVPFLVHPADTSSWSKQDHGGTGAPTPSTHARKMRPNGGER